MRKTINELLDNLTAYLFLITDAQKNGEDLAPLQINISDTRAALHAEYDKLQEKINALLLDSEDDLKKLLALKDRAEAAEARVKELEDIIKVSAQNEASYRADNEYRNQLEKKHRPTQE